MFPVEKTFTVRSLKLESPLYDGSKSSQRLNVSLSPAAGATVALYERSSSTASWRKVRDITLAQGKASEAVAVMERVVEPMLAGDLPRAHFADAVLQARLAAAKDPDGHALAETIAAIARTSATPGKIAAE